MTLDRKYVLGGLMVLSAAVAAALIADVLGTVFFAITVASLLLPLQRSLTDRGLSPWLSSAVATGTAFLGVVALVAPLLVIAFLRVDFLLEVLARLPSELTVEALGMTYTVTLEQAFAVAQSYLRAAGQIAVQEVPILLVKVTLFGFLVFSLLFHRDDVRRAGLALVPATYRDVAAALYRRTRETLFAIYVLQAATALGTFALAVPVFVALGYRAPFSLAVLAAILQFLPVVGPSLLVVALAGYHAALGNLALAAATFVVGGVVVAWLPDVLIRPRLARETAGLSGGLYFVGFVGGLLTMGAVGIIAGPLAVALVAEVVDLLAAELDGENGRAPADAGVPTDPDDAEFDIAGDGFDSEDEFGPRDGIDPDGEYDPDPSVR